ncbi:MAG: DUF4365 domain-containing protein [Acidimicrobiales bacterium]|jgi:hypothetical protein
MRRLPSARTASIGVAQTRLAVEERLEWLFREQLAEDYGIDAQIEVVEGESVKGRLLAVQIKSGESWFKEPGPNGWWFRPDDDHVQYWTNHSLPVVVVLYEPQSKRCHWQLVNTRTLVGTSTGRWKVLVPADQVLNETARAPLREAAEGDPYVLRIRELRLAKPWMELLSHDQRLVVEIDEWINKTSGRGSITLAVDREDGEEPSPLAAWSVFLGTASYADVVPQLFAWADVGLHEETYDSADHDQYEEECVFVDDEGDRFEAQEYQDWRASRSHLSELRPYNNLSGEVDVWRLELTLNDLGRAFLALDRFATTGDRQLTP